MAGRWATILGRCSGRRRWRALALGLCAAVAAGPGRLAAEAPRVVVSIAPVHSLVAGVMAGVGAPTLLIRGGASPHDAGLRPSGARALGAADLIVWVGPALETFLEKPLGALAGAARILTLTEAPGMRLLRLRKGGAFEPHTAPAGGQEAGRAGEPQGRNPHLWLDPRNAMRAVRLTAEILTELDAENGAAYGANAARLVARLDRLDRELRARLAPVKGLPYVVFHDAYAYFEARYGFAAAGAFTVNPAVPPGARRLVELRARMAELGALCVFAEPQFRPAVIAAVVEGTAARAATLDPLGAQIPPGPAAYFRLLRTLADDLLACLNPSE